MSVKIDGIGKLRANYYSRIVIKEEFVYGYSINVRGDKITYETDSVGDRFSEEFNSKSDIEQVKEIIEDYIRNAKICGWTDLINLPGYGEQRFNVVYGNFGYRQLLLKLYNPEFRDVFNKIEQKFYQDRFDFCYEEKGIKTFKISTCGVGSGWTIDLDKLHKFAEKAEYFKHIKLRTKGFILTDSEREFIRKFVIDIFSKFGEEIQIEKIYNSEYEWTRNEVIGYILSCGDVKIYFNREDTLLPIITDVFNYNTSIKKQKEESLKRQLRMEEV